MRKRRGGREPQFIHVLIRKGVIYVTQIADLKAQVKTLKAKLKAAAEKDPAGATEAREAAAATLRTIALELQNAINTPHPNDLSQFARIQKHVADEAAELEKP